MARLITIEELRNLVEVLTGMKQSLTPEEKDNVAEQVYNGLRTVGENDESSEEEMGRGNLVKLIEQELEALHKLALQPVPLQPTTKMQRRWYECPLKQISTDSLI